MRSVHLLPQVFTTSLSTRFAAVALSVAGAVACGSGDDGTAGTSACTPGEQIECACTGGTLAMQTCNPDGTYGGCNCPAGTVPVGGSDPGSTTPGTTTPGTTTPSTTDPGTTTPGTTTPGTTTPGTTTPEGYTYQPGDVILPGSDMTPTHEPVGDIAGERIEIDEGAFSIAPSEEGTYCVRIPLPEEFRDRDLVLVGVDSDLPVGTHHFFMAYTAMPVDSNEPVPCHGAGTDPLIPIVDGAAQADTVEGKLLFGAGVGQTGFRTNGTYGRFMKAGGHLWTDHHVLNLTSDVQDSLRPLHAHRS